MRKRIFDFDKNKTLKNRHMKIKAYKSLKILLYLPSFLILQFPFNNTHANNAIKIFRVALLSTRYAFCNYFKIININQLKPIIALTQIKICHSYLKLFEDKQGIS